MSSLASRIALSGVLGLIASAVALIALADSHVGYVGWGDPGLAPNALLALAPAALATAVPVALAVLTATLLYDAARWARRELVVAARELTALLCEALGSDAVRRSRRHLHAVGAALAQAAMWVVVVFACVFLLIAALAFGVMAVREATYFLSKLLEDPPPFAGMAVGMTGVFGLMYVGCGLLASSLAGAFLLIRPLWRQDPAMKVPHATDRTPEHQIEHRMSRLPHDPDGRARRP